MPSKRGIPRGGERSEGGWLKVRSLGLNHGHQYVLRSNEVILIEKTVLKGCAIHPHWALGFNEQTARVVDIYLIVVIEIVVSDPTCKATVE